MPVLDHSHDPVGRPRSDDLIVKAVTVQGGETDIAGEKTAFARIVMTGVDLHKAQVHAPAPRRQEAAVLKLDDAAALAAGLSDVVNSIVRSSPTPAVPASGIWSWTSEPLRDWDLLVARASANGEALAAATGTAATVRVDFTGTLVQGLTSADPTVHVQGAIFSGPRQVQALVSSLRKVVRSALEKRRLEIYVSMQESLPALHVDRPLDHLPHGFGNRAGLRTIGRYGS